MLPRLRTPAGAPAAPAAAALALLACAAVLTACHAAAIPSPSARAVAPAGAPELTAAAVPVSSESAAASKTFLVQAAAPAEAGPGVVADAADAADAARAVAEPYGAEPAGRAGLLPAGPQPALVRGDALAPAADLAAGPALDAAPARLRDGQRHTADVDRRLVADGAVGSAATASAAEPDAEDVASTRRVGHPGGLGQETPKKKPRFSDSYLPPLVQVLTHLVDFLEVREQAAVDPAEQTGGSAVSAPVHINPNATVAVEIEIVPLHPESGAANATEQFVLEGPVLSVAQLLAQLGHPLTITTQGKEGDKDAENGSSEDAPVDAVEDVTKVASTDSTAADDKEAAEDVTTVATTDSRVVDDVDEDMQADMPVVQRDVPIVNEETVPMMMMMDMVPSDAPEMVMRVDGDDDAEEAPAFGRAKRDAALKQAFVPDEFKTFVMFPTSQEVDGVDEGTRTGDDALSEILDTAEFEELKDDAFLLNSIRGEAAAVSHRAPARPSKSLLKIVKLRFALAADAKKQNFKLKQGFSDAVLADLVRTSQLSGRDQLGVLLTAVLHKDQIANLRTRQRAQAFLDELRQDDSDLSKSLDGVPALEYAP